VELEETAKLVANINNNVKTLSIVVDITSEESVEAAFATIDYKGLHVDALINNAGWMGGLGRIDESNADNWWYNFEVNVKGTYLVTRSYLKHLKGAEGTVANASTISAVISTPMYSGFGTSKMAEGRFTEYTALENPNVHAYAYYPGRYISCLSSTRKLIPVRFNPDQGVSQTG
jgi:NADP-dependent 3-hydroxy acid dehydrogenase YdfG